MLLLHSIPPDTIIPFYPNATPIPYRVCSNVDIPQISTEDAAQVTGRQTRSVSVMAEQCYAMSANIAIRSASLGATPSVRGTPVPRSPDPFTDQPSTPIAQQVRKTKAELMKNINQLTFEDPTLGMTPTEDRHRKGGLSGPDQNVPQQVSRLRLQSEPQQHLPQQPGPRQRAAGFSASRTRSPCSEASNLFTPLCGAIRIRASTPWSARQYTSSRGPRLGRYLEGITPLCGHPHHR